MKKKDQSDWKVQRNKKKKQKKQQESIHVVEVISCTKGKQGLDPGLTDDSIRFLTVEIDGDAPENANPKQKLDDGEIVEVRPLLMQCEQKLASAQDGPAADVCDPIALLFTGVDVVLVECNKLFEYVKSICKEIYVEAMVYSFAIGYNMRQ
ncbi:unnamed protein product [Toxocara canis]|uniref:PDZ domain-containing protein n=1 Tax=Toxocara canis TaxID=6265 RepID=A0A183UBF6_TOXCA|nr:unnamed protein product [Toxocara canis]